MSKILVDMIGDTNDNYAAASVSINFVLSASLFCCIFIKPIIFLLWLPYKIFTMLLVWVFVFNTLKDLKDKKIIKNDIDKINNNIKYISDNFIMYVLFSNTLLLASVCYFISTLSKFSWKDFVKNITTKANNFNIYIANKISNKFLIKEKDIIKESYRD